MKNKMTNIKTLMFLTSVFLISPLTIQAASILYSVAGTSTELGTTEIRSLTGYMVISDEAILSNDPNFPNSDSGITFEVETFVLTLDGIKSNSGEGHIRFEWDGVTWGGFNFQRFGGGGFLTLRSIFLFRWFSL